MSQLGHEDFGTTWDHYVHNVVEDGALELPTVLELLSSED